MSRPKLVSLFSGTGALDLAITAATGAETVAVADVCGDPKTKNWPHRTPCQSPCAILAHRFPGVPNLGDVSVIDWTPWVGLVTILCAGFPCQDVSTAGKRAGLKAGTRTGLWSEVVRAIVALKPRLVVLENVPGIFTAPASGDVEPCEVCLGDAVDEHLRALHAVLADLAEVGLDAEWVCVPASGVGAPHQRLRWFLVAYPAGQPWSFERGDGGDVAHPAGDGRDEGWAESTRLVRGSNAAKRGHADVVLLPSPRTSDTNGAGVHGDGGLDLRTAIKLLSTVNTKNNENRQSEGFGPNLGEALLPTPTATAPGGTADQYRARWKKSDGRDSTFLPLSHAVSLLPTPSVADTQGGRKGRSGDRSGELLLNGLAAEQRFGEYAPAIVRWERVTGRIAPDPTELADNYTKMLARRFAGTDKKPAGMRGSLVPQMRLSPKFTEWMMGLPDGWITDVPGITRNEALKACGNGVVPQQAVAALRHLLSASEAAA